MTEIDILSDDDLFFYYGEHDIQIEAQHDIMEQMLQPKRSYYYNRREAVGIDQYENYPSGTFLMILLRFLITDAIAYKNTVVEDGSYSDLDRRVALSQASIGIEESPLNIGELVVRLQYILFMDYETSTQMVFSLR